MEASNAPKLFHEAVPVFIRVPGIAAPQGSKVKTRWGMREDNPNTKPWRAAVASAATEAMEGRDLLAGPLKIECEFVFPRPKAHYGTGKNASVTKPSAPYWHTTKPDGDKLARAIGDALTGIVFRDDSLVAQWTIRKTYGAPAAAMIIVSAL